MGKKETLFCGAISILLFCVFIYGDEETNEDIFVEGIGYGSNETEAVMAAKRNAVEKGIGVVLLNQTEIENFQTKRDIVVSKTLAAVKSYEITSNTKGPDGKYSIKIKACMSRPTIIEDLDAFNILLKSMVKPKVMVIIQENNVGNEEPTNCTAQNSIIKFLKSSYEFEIVNPNIVASIKTSPQKMASLVGDVSNAASIGAMHGAEVIILGRADSRRTAENISDNLGGMKSVQADVMLKAINCTTGKVITSGSAHAAEVHISPNIAGSMAINLASEKAVKDLLNLVIEDWNRQINNGLPLIITINGVSSIRLKNIVVQTLKSIPGIVKVHDRAWNGEKKELLVDIQFKGNTNEFYRRVDRYKMTSGGGSLAVTGQNGTKISIVVQAK